jgi:hypothetical protein
MKAPDRFSHWCLLKLQTFTPVVPAAHDYASILRETAVQLFCAEVLALPPGKVDDYVVSVCLQTLKAEKPSVSSLQLLKVHGMAEELQDGSLRLNQDVSDQLLSDIQICGEGFASASCYDFENRIFKGKTQSGSSGCARHYDTGALVNDESILYDFYRQMQEMRATRFAAFVAIKRYGPFQEFIHRCTAAAAVAVIVDEIQKEQRSAPMPPPRAVTAAAAAPPLPRQNEGAMAIDAPPAYDSLSLPPTYTSSTTVRHVGSGQIGNVLCLGAHGAATVRQGAQGATTVTHVTMNTGQINVSGSAVANQIIVSNPAAANTIVQHF